MTNPNNALGTNAAFSGRTTPYAFNDVLAFMSGSGILSGWKCSPSEGMTVALGGDGEIRDVAIASEPTGNRTTINNRTTDGVAVEIAEAPEVGTRIDVIVAYVINPPEITQEVAGDNPECCGIIAVEGVADASVPTAPDDTTIRSAITADGAGGETAYYVVLAKITVSSGTTEITADLIEQGDAAEAATGTGVTLDVPVAVSEWADIANVSPFKASATVSAGYDVTPATIVELINNQAVLFANYGFAIASVDSGADTLTIYATKAPEGLVTLTVNYKEVR